MHNKLSSEDEYFEGYINWSNSARAKLLIDDDSYQSIVELGFS